MLEILSLKASSGFHFSSSISIFFYDGPISRAIATALVRTLRTELPAPEDILSADPATRGEAPNRAGFEGSTWFKINAGKRHNADPRWLLPLICRRGQVTKNEVGTIRIFDRDNQAVERAIVESGASSAPVRARCTSLMKSMMGVSATRALSRAARVIPATRRYDSRSPSHNPKR